MSQAISTIIEPIVTRTSSFRTERVGREDANAALIRLCDGVVELEDKLDRLHADCPDDIEAEKRIEPQASRLWKQRDRIVAKLARNLEASDGLPTSAAGAVAVAHAALALAPRDSSGDLAPGDDAEWLAYTACEWLVDNPGGNLH